MKRSLIPLIPLVALLVVGCTRSASKAPTDTSVQTGQATEELPFPTPALGGQEITDEMSTAVAGGFATQTAIAAQAAGREAGLEGGATATPQAPQNSPTPAPPTATPKPKKTESPASEPSSCTSPYTVQQGEWVWAIGRKCNIHPDAIIEANNLKWPYTIYPGDELILPEDAPPFP
jgi:LysM repeat protein